MKCMYGGNANTLCLSNQCSKHPLFCSDKRCECSNFHSEKHGNISIQQIKQKVENKNSQLKTLKQILQQCNQFMIYLKNETNKIQTYIQQNLLSDNTITRQHSQNININSLTLKNLIKISEENISDKINMKVLNNIPSLLENIKSHFKEIWQVADTKKSANELFSRFNRKIQGKRNVLYLHLNHVNIIPVPQTFDYTKLTGIRLTVIDIRTIELLSSYCLSLRRLEIYQENTLKNKHVFQIARLLKNLVYLNFNLQNVSNTAVLKIAHNLALLKSFTVYTRNDLDENLKNKFRKIRPTCHKLSM